MELVLGCARGEELRRLEAMAQDEGHFVLACCADGRQLLAKAASLQPDALLCDLPLPYLGRPCAVQGRAGPGLAGAAHGGAPRALWPWPWVCPAGGRAFGRKLGGGFRPSSLGWTARAGRGEPQGRAAKAPGTGRARTHAGQGLLGGGPVALSQGRTAAQETSATSSYAPISPGRASTPPAWRGTCAMPLRRPGATEGCRRCTKTSAIPCYPNGQAHQPGLSRAADRGPQAAIAPGSAGRPAK